MQTHFARVHPVIYARLSRVWATVLIVYGLAWGITAGGGVSPSTGPVSGGNLVIITGDGLGSGTDITNVTLCGVVATIVSQTSTSVTALAGAGGLGAGDAVVRSAGFGVTVLSGAYTYNPQGYIAADAVTWGTVSNLPVSRGLLGATVADRKIYAMGGYNGGWQSQVHVYDTTRPTQGWASLSNLPVGRGGTGVVSARGKIYSIGGHNASGEQSAVYVYDPLQPAQGWRSVSNLPIAIYSMAAVTVDEKVYVMGGYGAAVGCPTAAFKYDPDFPALGWQSISNMPAGRNDVSAAALDGKIYVMGGSDGTYQSTVFVYDTRRPDLGWGSVSNLPATRYVVGAASVNGKVYCVGGFDGTTHTAVQTVFAYDPAMPQRGWVNASNLPAARGEAPAVAVDGRIYLISGAQASLSYQPTVFLGTSLSGVSPSSGPTVGGTVVTIRGNNLGNGVDITNVTLCGVATGNILSQSATQVVVTAGASMGATSGAVVVYSEAFGISRRETAYTYVQVTPPAPLVLGPTDVSMHGFRANWAAVSNATGYLLDASSASNFAVCLAGLSNLSVGLVTSRPIDGLDAGGTYYYRVRAQQGGATSAYSATMAVTTVGGMLSLSNGPASGGNTVTIAGAGLGDGSDITNVTICGVTALIASQTSSSVTVVVGVGGTGLGNVAVRSVSRGTTTFVGAYRYNPQGSITDDVLVWGTVSNLPVSRGLFNAATVNGKIYAMGGYNGGWCSQVHVYDTAMPTQGWVSLSNLPVGRGGTGVVAARGKIYCIGGHNESGEQSAVYVYDPERPDLGWQTVSNLPVAVYSMAAVTVDEQIYVMGGCGAGVGCPTTVFRYDPEQPATGWQPIGNMPAGRNDVTAAALDGKIYVLGGSDGTYQSTVFVYDTRRPDLGWGSVSNLPATRYVVGAASVNGKVYCVGGFDGTTHTAVNTVFVYDPARPEQGWLNAASLPAPRGEAPAVAVNGKLYFVSGAQASLSYQPTVFEGVFVSGVSPSSGSLSGGGVVTIQGVNLGNGSDITNVTLCGISAGEIVSQSATQVIVVAGAASIPTNGAVSVFSISYGITTREGAYSYTAPPPPAPSVSPATGVTARGFVANWAPVGDVTSYVIDVAATSNFAVCVNGFYGRDVGDTTSCAVDGLSAGVTYYYRLRSRRGALTSTNSGVISVRTSGVSVNVATGPAAGGNAIVISGEALGDGSDITNVTVCGVPATIVSQTSNMVSVIVGAGGSGEGSIVVMSAGVGKTVLAGGYRYNPRGFVLEDTLTWTTVSSLPVSRGLLNATVADGKIYAMGGYNYGWYPQVHMYDPAKPGQGWLGVASMPVGRGGLGAVTVKGKVYSIGGHNYGGEQSAVYVYDPQQPAQGWRSVSNLPIAVYSMAAVAVDDKIYVMGGYGATVGLPVAAFKYDPDQPGMGWQSISNMPAGRNDVTATALDGKIYVLGGSDGTYQSTVFVYDTARPELGWGSISNLPAARYVVGAASLNGKVYCIGGFDGTTHTAVSTVFAYDPAQPERGWFSAGNLPAPRGEAPAVVANGKIYFISGAQATLSYQPTVFEGSFGEGVVPSSGPLAGGTVVTIRGNNLGNGADITNVALCGVSVAEIVSQSTTQVIVRTAASAVPAANGPVSVYSTSYGIASRQKAYSYTGEVLAVTASAGPNGSVVPSGIVPLVAGATTNFIVEADPGHHIAEVFVDGVAVGLFGPGSNVFSYTFSNVTTSHTLHATFNTPPEIRVAATPTNGVAPLRVLFDFGGSSDEENNIVRCEVDRDGDGIFETSSEGVGRVIVEYGAPGLYSTVARVIDACGATSEAILPVTVWGQAPEARLEAVPLSDPAPLNVVFAATNSTAAAGHRIVVYEWDFDGDGTYDAISQTGLASHIYRTPGVFQAALRVTDDQGLQDRDSVPIAVLPPVLTPPSVTLIAAPNAGAIPLPVAFTAAVTNGGAIVEYRWDFDGDGRVDLLSPSGMVTHTYGQVGTYLARVTAVDDAGLSGVGTATVTTREMSTLRVWIVQPREGQRVRGGAVSLNANATPANQVQSVSFQYRVAEGAWVDIGAPLIPPPSDFRTTWCVTNLADGTVCELQAVAEDGWGDVVTSEVVTVTVDAASGKKPGLVVEGAADGTHAREETFGANESATLSVYDGTAVTVPAGTTESNLTVAVELTGFNTNAETGAAYGQASINENRRVSIEGDPVLGQPIAITLPYPDENNDGVVDGTTVPESTLAAYWFDTGDGKWKKPLSCEVDTSAKRVRIKTYHLTEFGLFGSRNLLLPENGGMLVSCSFEGTDATAATSLTDGNPASYWMGPTNAGVQEFVYTFTNYQGVVCSEAVIYNYGQAGQGLTNYSRDYAILVSMDGSVFAPVATGVLPAAEGPVVIDMGRVTCRVIKLVVSSGYGERYEVAEFELHGRLTSDPNGNGMSDAWEMQWFGAVERTGQGDFDADGLSDKDEFIYGSNPSVDDTDWDGMPDGWEVRYGLRLLSEDSADDADGDGLPNGGEYIAGTDPTNDASTFRMPLPELIGSSSQSIWWDETNAVWETGAWFRVDGLIFSWPTVSGRVYRLSSTTNLLGRWESASPVVAGSGTMSCTNWTTNTVQRFYRLQVDLP